MNYKNELTDLLNQQSDTKSNDIEGLHEKPVYIFGAGLFAGYVFTVLNDKGVKIKGFLVNRKYFVSERYYEHDVMILESLTKEQIKNSIIIISFQADKQSIEKKKQELVQMGFEEVYHYGVFGKEIYSPAKLFNAKEQVLEALDYFQDDESKETYCACLKAIIKGNFDYFSSPSKELQYFPNTFKLSKGYSKFIDCGAFNGDTALSLKKHSGLNQVNKAVFFEPDLYNVETLSKTVKDNNVALESIIFPCGVSDKYEMVKFMDKCGTGVSGHISEDGETIIQCVPIDSVLPTFSPTFIKMDIEGSEIKALIGAQETIKQVKPDLAICVYHDVEHLYKIPLLIKSLHPDYKLYLRSHAYYFCETVLYATTE